MPCSRLLQEQSWFSALSDKWMFITTVVKFPYALCAQAGDLLILSPL
jgi:hypothetical protein